VGREAVEVRSTGQPIAVVALEAVQLPRIIDCVKYQILHPP